MHCKWILHAGGAGLAAELVVQLDRTFYHCGGRIELWICADHRRSFEEVAIHIFACRLLDVFVWHLLLLYSQFAGGGVVLEQGRENRCCGEAEEGADGRSMSED